MYRASGAVSAVRWGGAVGVGAGVLGVVDGEGWGVEGDIADGGVGLVQGGKGWVCGSMAAFWCKCEMSGLLLVREGRWNIGSKDFKKSEETGSVDKSNKDLGALSS